MRSRSCLVIGGGVVGLSLAYELSRVGWTVSIVDRGAVGREASWAGAGILPPANPNSAIHAYEQLRGLSFDLHAEWAERLRSETGIDTGYRRCGGIYLAQTPGEWASLLGFSSLMTEEGVLVERPPLDELARLEPELSLQRPAASRQPGTSSTTAIRGGLVLPDECQLRNPWHLQALTTACRRQGVEILEQVSIERWTMNGDHLSELETSQGKLAADSYCVTAGAWSAHLLESLGVSLGVVPIRGQMVLLKTERALVQRIINVGPRYLVPREDGYLLVGSTEEEVGFDKRTTPNVIDDLLHFAWELVPSLRLARMEKSWSGLRPGVYDGLPYLGQLPGLANVFIAAGHFRSGLYLSPGTAVVMAAVMAGEKPCIDIRPFRVNRT
ncbi:MAG: glycine oxidase ThiO [Pirellulales bacterium]